MLPTSPQRGRSMQKDSKRGRFQQPMQRESQQQQHRSHGHHSSGQHQSQSHEHHSGDRQQPQSHGNLPSDQQQPQQTPDAQSKHFMLPRSTQRTHPALWLAAVCCTLMWIIIILGGILVLVIYLVFRPKSPLLDIQSATLNAAYLDTGTLLNADITILANFSNPNRKVDVAFSYVQVDLSFLGTMIATQAVEPFAERRGESALKSLHMVASEVALPPEAAKEWQRGTTEEGVALGVEGRFRTRSDFGKWLHFTYWLYGRCTIVIGAPPSGVLLSRRCRTKR